MSGRSPRVLIVDDEPKVREVVVAYLEHEGFRVATAADAGEARSQLAAFSPDLVVLDVMFPGASGLELLREIRVESDLPVILLTARAEESDRVVGLELGADDYVVKPFSPRELTARVKSVLRRSRPPDADTTSPLEFDRLRIDPSTREVTVDGVEVALTAREFEVLVHMASHPKQVFSRNDLLEQVWDSSAEWQDPATVTVHIRRLRSKIEADPSSPRHLETVWGVGYRFQP